MVQQKHDIFLRAHAVVADDKKKHNHNPLSDEESKWPQHTLVFDTETRITADQSLTFGVYRRCKLRRDRYEITEEGIFHADELPLNELHVLKTYMDTAIPDAKFFPPRFPLYPRTEFMKRVFWPAIRYDNALICGLNLPLISPVSHWPGTGEPMMNGRSRCRGFRTEWRIATAPVFSSPHSTVKKHSSGWQIRGNGTNGKMKVGRISSICIP